MLRRKLLTRLGVLVLGFVLGAVVSIVLLQGVLQDLDGINAKAKVEQLDAAAHTRVAAEQEALSKKLRNLIVGLTIAALVMMNITVIMLLHTAQMVLRPVAELVDASRRLGQQQFDHRVTMDGADEFAELARAYNRMGEELAESEHRKVESLQHLAVTLNHELNNVVTIIDFQLSLLDRRSGGDPNLAKLFRDIRENLGRISTTVASLRNVRRVVLTDYMPGEKMLDLARSLAIEDPSVATLMAPVRVGTA